MTDERTKPDFEKNAMVDLRGKTFDALVPGKEEFAWGAEYLRRSDQPTTFRLNKRSTARNNQPSSVAV